jgi:hypothetical protein
MFVFSLAFGLLLLVSEAFASPRSTTLITPRHHSFLKNSKRQRYNQATLISTKTTSATMTHQESTSLINPIPPNTPDEIPKWQDLSFHWKCVFGGIEIAYIVGTQWLSGFTTAYLLGSITGLHTFSQPPEVGLSRFSRWNQRNIRWGKSWGSVSASFSGFDAGVRLLRNNQMDEWNSLLGSACAGAFFVRSQGPAAMAKSAAMYASVGYFIMRAGRQKYVEQEHIL